jgi:hypothetical protein
VYIPSFKQEKKLVYTEFFKARLLESFAYNKALLIRQVTLAAKPLIIIELLVTFRILTFFSKFILELEPSMSLNKPKPVVKALKLALNKLTFYFFGDNKKLKAVFCNLVFLSLLIIY